MNKFYETIKEQYDYIFPLNLKQVEFVKSEFPDCDNKLIEIGCANGKLTNALSQYNIRGIDLEQSFIEIARQRYKGIQFDSLNMVDIDVLNERFDGIICFGNTLVHLKTEEIEAFISNCYSSLNKGGKLIIQILNYDNILDNQVYQLPLIDNEHIKFERCYEFGDRLKFITKLTIKKDNVQISNAIYLTPIRKSELEEMLVSAGFKDIKFYGSFAKVPLKEDSLPLVLCCKK